MWFHVWEIAFTWLLHTTASWRWECICKETGFTLQLRKRISLHHNYSSWTNSSKTCTYLQVISLCVAETRPCFSYSHWTGTLGGKFLSLSPFSILDLFSLNTISLSSGTSLPGSSSKMDQHKYIPNIFFLIEYNGCSWNLFPLICDSQLAQLAGLGSWDEACHHLLFLLFFPELVSLLSYKESSLAHLVGLLEDISHLKYQETPATKQHSEFWVEPDIELTALERAIWWLSRLSKLTGKGFSGGAVIKNLPVNAGDTGSSPGLGRSHIPRINEAHAPQLLSLRSRVHEPQLLSSCATTTEAHAPRAHAPQQEKPPQWKAHAPQWIQSRPRSLQLEKARA